MAKPRFNSLADALAYIREKALIEERRLWQSMQQRDINMGGGWD
jgi:hypothetical protein